MTKGHGAANGRLDNASVPCIGRISMQPCHIFAKYENAAETRKVH